MSERTMYEWDHAKDQVMTTLKLALANLILWTRDRYFPATYAQATWHRLSPYFRLPGRIKWGSDPVQVELRPFNDRRLTCDLAWLCQRVKAARPSGKRGRAVALHLTGARRLTVAGQQGRVA